MTTAYARRHAAFEPTVVSTTDAFQALIDSYILDLDDQAVSTETVEVIPEPLEAPAEPATELIRLGWSGTARFTRWLLPCSMFAWVFLTYAIIAWFEPACTYTPVIELKILAAGLSVLESAAYALLSCKPQLLIGPKYPLD